ncbi:hypothetical protein BD410DRAFT_781052 [Rickenella mellea]|uniref:Uncharacterized protein n=1 Tax=Rickenella mellea TaxID=50990 RepID=A0A4Y7QMR9_9AGAM|nr:hypothetical protein BD410DRAFT_781052 [Rickenella mellea]
MASETGHMEIDDSAPSIIPEQLPPAQVAGPSAHTPNPVPEPVGISGDVANLQTPPQRESFRELAVKVHIRRSGRDAWSYLGRAFVTQELAGHNSRVVVRSATSGKIMATFSESSDLQAEKRGNFVVISCVESSGIVSWSLNAMNNSETLKLLASIELACYRSRQVVADPKQHSKLRRRIERLIKDDRRKRHKRRRDEEAMIEAFGKQQIEEDIPSPPEA